MNLIEKNALFQGVLFFCAASIFARPLQAEIRLPHTLSDHAVLQRDCPIPIWGWSNPNAPIEVQLGEAHAETKANDLGEWRAVLPALGAGGPYRLTVTGDGSHLAVEDLLIGDVWIASGQSNMEMPLKGFGHANPVQGGEQAAAEAHSPSIRLLLVPHAGSAFPQRDISANWQLCAPETAREFSAVGYFFAQRIQKDIGVAIGIVDSTWGGAPAESWTSLEAITSDATLMPVLHQYAEFMAHQADLPALKRHGQVQDAAARDAGRPMPSHPWHPDPMSWTPAALYNGMIAPLTPMPIRGVIWYQGETNSRLDRAPLYRGLLTTMITDWRTRWKQADLPFLFAQISSFRSTPEEDWGMLRDAQRRTLALPNTAMAVTLDVGNPVDVHPADKLTVANRLAGLAEQKVYGSTIDAEPALFSKVVREKSSLRVVFSRHDLECRGVCEGFEIAGSDEQFVPAEARLSKGEIVLRASGVAKPIYARYAWANAPVVSLFSSNGQPASTFTSQAVAR